MKYIVERTAVEPAIEQLAKNSNITHWQGKDKFEWIIEKWLKDPSIRIDGTSPVVWRINDWDINKPGTIGGKEATEWLKAQDINSEVFELLVIANLASPRKERLSFIDITIQRNNMSVDTHSNSTPKQPAFIDEDSIVWMVKNLPVEKGKKIIHLLQEKLQKDGNSTTLVEWLREKGEVDLLGHLYEKQGVNFALDGKGVKAWLQANKDRIALIATDRAMLDYDATMNRKYAEFWGITQLQNKQITLESLNVNENQLPSDGAYLGGQCNGDFWQALDSVKIFELALIKLLIAEVEPTKVFTKYGNNVNGINPDTGRAPLHWGIGNIEITRLLLKEFGANPNVRNVEGETPAHLVASNGSLEVLQCLYENGADLTAVNNKGHSVLQSAVIDHNPGAIGGRDRMEVIRWLIDQDLQSKKYQPWIFGKTLVVQDGLIAKDASGKTAVEIAVTEGLSDVEELFRATMASRINTKLYSFLKILYLPDLNKAEKTIPLIITHPQEAIKHAKECFTTLSNYLPLLTASVFNSRGKGYKIISCHNKEFPNGVVKDRDTGELATGDIADAGKEVYKVFEIIEKHGVVNQQPKNFQLAASSSLAAGKVESPEEIAACILSRLLLRDSRSHSNDNSIPMITPKEKPPILLIVPQKLIQQHRDCAEEFFSNVITKFQNKKNDPILAQEAKVLENLLKEKLRSRFQTDIHEGADNYLHSMFCRFIKQFQQDLEANKNIDKSKFKTLESYKNLQHIQELLTGVQIQWGNNLGWCKNLEAERATNQNQVGYGGVMANAFQRLLGGSTTPPQAGNALF